MLGREKKKRRRKREASLNVTSNGICILERATTPVLKTGSLMLRLECDGTALTLEIRPCDFPPQSFGKLQACNFHARICTVCRKGGSRNDLAIGLLVTPRRKWNDRRNGDINYARPNYSQSCARLTRTQLTREPIIHTHGVGQSATSTTAVDNYVTLDRPHSACKSIWFFADIDQPKLMAAINSESYRGSRSDKGLR